jgi:hypothetical protein
MLRDRRVALYVAAGVVAGFLVGFLWQYALATSARSRLAAVEHEHAFQQLEGTLAVATIEAQRGSYEIARQFASDFFSGLQTQAQRVPAPARAEIGDILARRDDMITALSRNDPQAAPMLAQLFVRYRGAFGRPVGPEATTRPSPLPPAEPVGPDSPPPD